MAKREATDQGLVVRAGAVSLLSFGTLEKRSTLRGMMTEAMRGQNLHTHQPKPQAEPEPGEDLEEEPDDLEEAEELEDDDGEDDEEDEEDPGDTAYAEPDDPEQKYRVVPWALDALLVYTALERWLFACPQGAIKLGAKSAGIPSLALGCGWASTVVHRLARGPRSLAELDREIEPLSRETLQRYLEAMEDAGQVERVPGDDGEPRYAVTDWLRAGIAPLIAAARREILQPEPVTAPPDELDIEATFLLALPLLELPDQVSGSCRLGVEAGGTGPPLLTGVTAHVEEGRVTAVPGLDQPADAWAVASTADWLETVVYVDAKRVKTGGDLYLAHFLVNGLRERLFGSKPLG